MKRILALVTVSLLLGTTGTILAAPVTVNFGSLGIEVIDITNNIGYTLNNVQFLFDNGGLGDSASITNHGIDVFSVGGGFGSDFLTMSFLSGPIFGGLNFAFLVGPAGVYSDGASVVLNNALPDATMVGTNSSGIGTVNFSPVSGPYTQALVFPTANANAQVFGITSLAYDVPKVPEPSSLFLLGPGLLGLGFVRRFVRKH